MVQGGYVSGRAAQQLHVTKKANALAGAKERDKDRSPTPATNKDSHAGTPASATPPPAFSAAVVCTHYTHYITLYMTWFI